jgi:hypothetical protein
MNSTFTIESVHGIKQTFVLGPMGTADRSADRGQQRTDQERNEERRREQDDASKTP